MADMKQLVHSEVEAAQLRVIRELECKRISGLSRTQRWRLERVGKFPKRIPLSEKAHGWLEIEIQGWIRDRLALRDAAKCWTA
jgi:prophage regulatory protein